MVSQNPQLGPTEEQLREALRRKRERAENHRNRLREQGMLKVTPDLVRAVRAAREDGKTYAELAEEFDINVTYIQRICLRTVMPSVE